MLGRTHRLGKHAGFATLFPVIPTLVTNGFASQAAGHYVDCQQFTPATSPPYCRDAHRQVRRTPQPF